MLYRTTQKMCSCKEVYNIWRKLTLSIAIHLNGSCSYDTGDFESIMGPREAQEIDNVESESDF